MIRRYFVCVVWVCAVCVCFVRVCAVCVCVLCVCAVCLCAVCVLYKRLAFSFLALFWIFYNCVCLHATYPCHQAFSLVKHLKKGYSFHVLHSNLLPEFNAFFQIYCQIIRYCMRSGVLCTVNFMNHLLGVGEDFCNLLGVYPICRETSCFHVKCMPVYPMTDAPDNPEISVLSYQNTLRHIPKEMKYYSP